MPELISLATLVPSHVITLEETKERIGVHLASRSAATRFRDMAEHSRIAQRHLVLPTSEVVRRQTIEERQRAYCEHAIELSEAVASGALASSGIAPSSVGAVVSVSCTGYMMPSLEVHLGHRLGLNPAARRIPIMELGCSAGVAAFGLARELLQGGAARSALIVSTELSSLCVQMTEPAVSDVMGWILFGDASAAAVLTSDESGKGLRVVGSRSVLWPESTSDLGMRLTTTGFRLELSSQVPRLIRRHIRPTVEAFLADHGVVLGEIAFWAIHPGGPRVLECVGESLGLAEDAMQPTWDVWSRCGNVSSATVFLVLRALLDTRRPAPDSLGMLLAAGPGLSCEMVLLRAPRSGDRSANDHHPLLLA